MAKASVLVTSDWVSLTSNWHFSLQDEVPAIPKISQTIVSVNLGADQHNVASPRLEVEQDLGDGDDQQVYQFCLSRLNFEEASWSWLLSA